ncbi:MAG TPA: tyrosine-type recombinase/integrase [Gammaproteobacteria bacterium]|nr:tyrosine-type recombinase/integrase [Gammaproteobacteria bacterium]
MGRKQIPGLVKRNQVWHIDKTINGQRVCESTETSDLQEAERYLARKLELIRQATVYGVRPKRIFREAVLKYLEESGHKASLITEIEMIKQLDPYIGMMTLEAVHMGSLQAYIADRKKQGAKNRTINYGLQITRQILNLAAGQWLDEYGLTWLATAPKIKLLPESDKRKPHPISWEDQELLFPTLPDHLVKMALFAVNTGCRSDTEICRLRWEWEVPIPELNRSVFIIPDENVKNREDRLVVLNDIAWSVINEVRGQHPVYVFTFRNRPMTRMSNTAWKRARKRAGIDVRVHDLKHTFGRRLRAAGVSFEDRQDLLGHKSQRITTHYSAAELANLITAANKACIKRYSSVLASARHMDLNSSYIANNATDTRRLAAKKASLLEILNSREAMNVNGGHAKFTQAVLH